jgi:hypothetical protein
MIALWLQTLFRLETPHDYGVLNFPAAATEVYLRVRRDLWLNCEARMTRQQTARGPKHAERCRFS